MRPIYPLLLSAGIIAWGCVPIDRNLIGRQVRDTTVPFGTNGKFSTPFLIRVAISVRQPSVRLSAPEAFVMSGFPTDTVSLSANEHRYRELVLTSDKLFAHKAYIKPLGEGQITVNGRKYLGAMEIVEDKKGTLTVINEVELEDYIMGVLAGEVPHDWPLEALKAQAIAARTFAVLKKNETQEQKGSYDMENTSFFQVYRGSDEVNDNIVKAVALTRRDIATYKSSPIKAFFHSNCGGSTTKAIGVWSSNEPYLQCVHCPFGNNGPHFRWRSEIPVSDLVRKLRSAGIYISDVVRVSASEHDESGRILKLSIMDADGKTKTMKGSAFRMALGPDLIRSTRFDAVTEGEKMVFNGKGWGHGVGLCQEGACAMAYKGYSCFDILRYYYKGITVEKLKTSNLSSPAGK
jgi:stage II sporulation protein D